MAMPPQPPCDRAQISSLMDEVLSPQQMDALLQSMDTPQARECWQMYHLIGDVLRAPELANCGQDTQLVARVHAQIQAEALPEQPAAPSHPLNLRQTAANDAVFRWKLVAGLSSVAAVAVMSWGLWLGQGPHALPEAQLAQQSALPRPATPAITPLEAQAEAPPTLLANTPTGPLHEPVYMLRDPELDQLLAAHGQASGVAALPSGFLRNATFEGPGR